MSAAEDLVKFLGFELTEDTTEKELKEWAAKQFVNVKDIGKHEKVNAIVGERLGANQTSIKSAFKDAGVEFAPGKVDRFEDMVNAGVSHFTDTISNLEAKLKVAQDGNPDTAKDLEDKILEINDLKNQVKDLNGITNTLKGTITEKDESLAKVQAEREQFIFDQKRNEYHGKLNLDKNANELTIGGFLSKVDSSYKYKLIKQEKEDGKVDYDIEVRTLDGDLIDNPDKHGETLGYLDVYKREAAKHNLLHVNNDGGKLAPTQSHATPQKNNENKESQGAPKRPVARGSVVRHRGS